MKSSRFILASFLALAFAGMASAQTIVHITGSTAFRAAAHQAILSMMPGATYGYSGTSLNSASQAIFTGTAVTTNGGNVPVIVKTSWSGSVGGIIVLTQQLPVPDTAIGVTGGWLVNSTSQSTSGIGGVAANYDAPTPADASFSDSFQSSTQFPTPALSGANGYNQGVVGVIPFQWVSGVGNPTTIKNVTSQNARSVLAGGTTLAFFTGNSADTALVKAFGRDSDSGTRLETFAETGYGILTFPVQYDPQVSGGVITQLDAWPAQFTDGISFPAGSQGFASGGGVAGALNTPGSQSAANNPADMIGYLGITDAASVTGGTTLTFNGYAYSPAAVQYGQYTLWSYEHVYYPGTYIGSAGQPVVDQIAQNIHNNLANTTASGLLLSGMQVHRQVEGGVILTGKGLFH